MRISLMRAFVLFLSACVILFVVAAAILVQNTFALHNILTNQVSETLERTELSGQVNTDFFRGVAEALMYARTGSPDARASAETELADATTLVEQLRASETDAENLTDQAADAEFFKIQQQREAVLTRYQTTMRALLAAIDSGDTSSIQAALTRFDQTIQDVEQLEEETGAYSDTAIVSAESAAQSAIQGVLTSFAIAAVLITVIGVVAFISIRRGIIKPINMLATAAQAISSGQYDQVVAVTERTEIGTLQQSFNEMARNLATTQVQLAEEQRILESRVAERTASLQQALDDLQRTSRDREQLMTTVRQLASPIMPVMQGVLVMPLIGIIDADRAEGMLQDLLHAIELHRAATVILDVTGVPLIDTAVAKILLQAGASAQLLGARTILVGLRPELAQTIVGLGANLSTLQTAADLQSGVRMAI